MPLNVQMILSRARESSYCHSIRSFGEGSPEKVFYVIWRERGAGFFSNVFHVLGHLTIADSLGMAPVVDMQNFKTFYNEADPINGTRNAWEYYFRQPCDISLDTVNKSKYVVFCNGVFIDSFNDDTETLVRKIETLERIIRKYLHVHSHIQRFCDDFVSEFFAGKKVLAIHFRGQDQRHALHHPTPTPPQPII